MDKKRFLDLISKGLIVSCQALPGEPFYKEEESLMPYFALAAQGLEQLVYVQILFEILLKLESVYHYQ